VPRLFMLTVPGLNVADPGCRHRTHPHRNRQYASAVQAPPSRHRCPVARALLLPGTDVVTPLLELLPMLLLYELSVFVVRLFERRS
jgi:hypothetical protein